MKRLSIMIPLVILGFSGYGQAPISVNSFTFDLYKNLSQEKNNLVFSPISITPAFDMVALGAKGETLNKINSTFHFEKNKQFPKQMGNLLKDLKSRGNDSVNITITNRVWIEKSYKTSCKFRRALRSDFRAKIGQTSFVSDPEGSRNSINSTIETDTRGFIKNLLPQGSIDNLTRLVLTNAVYFKGKWEIPFDPKKSSQRMFYPSNGKEVKHKFMYSTNDFGYYSSDDFSALELNYYGDELSLLIILPNKGTSLQDFSQKLNVDTYNNIIENLAPEKISVNIPVFKLETSLSLKKTLSEMGMGVAFSDDADFSGISGKTDLKISDAFHKAYIEVSEEGTTAAAATAVVVAVKSVFRPTQTFIADHPFVYILRDKTTNTILFIGNLENPED